MVITYGDRVYAMPPIVNTALYILGLVASAVGIAVVAILIAIDALFNWIG